MNKAPLIFSALSILLFGCGKNHEHEFQSASIQKMTIPLTSISVKKALINNSAEFSAEITLSEIGGILPVDSRYCFMEFISYFSSTEDLSFDDLRWHGKSGSLKYAEENKISMSFNRNFYLAPDEAGVDHNKDQYFTALITIRSNDDRNEILFKTWETVEVPWEIKTPNQQVEPIVTTPLDKVEAQSTQAHP